MSREEEKTNPLLDRTTRIVETFLANNQARPEDVTVMIRDTYKVLEELNTEKTVEPEHPPQIPEVPAEVNVAVPEPEPQKPWVPVDESVRDDYIICLEDGKMLKTLKRHLWSAFGMTPEDYRRKWNLPHDYPMVAPSYARQRSALAKATGLGRKPEPPPEPKAEEPPNQAEPEPPKAEDATPEPEAKKSTPKKSGNGRRSPAKKKEAAEQPKEEQQRKSA